MRNTALTLHIAEHNAHAQADLAVDRMLVSDLDCAHSDAQAAIDTMLDWLSHSHSGACWRAAAPLSSYPL